jgi:predicted transcriptional regulator of viral defense system
MKIDTDSILALAHAKGLLRPRDVETAGASHALLTDLVEQGRLVKLARGVYALPDRAACAYDSFAEVAVRNQTGVICLISALRFHELSTHQGPEVWLALSHKAYAPGFDYPPLRIVRMAGPAMAQGIEVVDIAGTPTRIFSVAKTLADCFKYRNKIGLDVALAALRRAWDEKRVTIDELWRYAEICRVANVMRPYMESMGVA